MSDEDETPTTSDPAVQDAPQVEPPSPPTTHKRVKRSQRPHRDVLRYAGRKGWLGGRPAHEVQRRLETCPGYVAVRTAMAETYHAAAPADRRNAAWEVLRRFLKANHQICTLTDGS